MVLSQIAITSPAFTNYNIGCFGKVMIKILDLKYMDGTAVANNDLMLMRSSVLNFPHNSKNGLIFTNKSNHNQFIAMNTLDIQATLSGFIDLTITQFDGSPAASFEGAVLTMDIVNLEDYYKKILITN